MPDASLIETLTAEKPTHTPGHWYVKQRNGQKRPTICEHTYGGKAIAQMCDGQSRETARLIASAPELLAAVREMVATTDMIGRSKFHYAAEYDRWCKAVVGARKAIAKAEAGK